MSRILIVAAFAILTGCASVRPIEVQTVSDNTALENAEPFEVSLSNFSFEPSTITLREGQAYQITLINNASGAHNFAAPDFLEAARIASSDAAKVADGKIEVAGNSTQAILLIPAAGTYDLTCTHFGHAALGMSGKIIVE